MHVDPSRQASIHLAQATHSNCHLGCKQARINCSSTERDQASKNKATAGRACYCHQVTLSPSSPPRTRLMRFSARRAVTPRMRRLTICAICSARSGSKMMNSSTRLMNSGRKCFRTCAALGSGVQAHASTC
jgi:hypothetical protein